jgi:hypothetical protein
MVIPEGCPFDTVCFHCQQAVEKYLKALLTLLGIPAPRTHDLEVLHKLLPANSSLSVSVEALVELNPYGSARSPEALPLRRGGLVVNTCLAAAPRPGRTIPCRTRRPRGLMRSQWLHRSEPEATAQLHPAGRQGTNRLPEEW